MLKYLRIYFSILLLLFFLKVNSQEKNLDKKIDLTYTDVYLKKILKDIGVLSGSTFSYSSRLIPQSKIETISFEQESIKNILKELFKDLDIDFIEYDGIIILKSRKEIQELKRKIEQSGKLSNKEVPKKRVEYSTFKGYLRDADNGEVLIGAVIAVDSLNIGTQTNEYGFYSLTVPEGTYLVRFSIVGYDQRFEFFDLHDDISFDIEMSMNNQLLEEVSIKAIDYMGEQADLNMSNIVIPLSTLNSLPAYLGEADLLKHLEKIPGVKSFGDGSTSYYVRGGDKGQNLIILDDAPIFNPSHLFGFYSSFVPEVIKDVKIYKGNAPANFGGRLSSIVDVRTKDGNMKQFEATGSVGPFTSKLQLETPIVKDKSSALIAFRRANINWFISGDDPKLNFYDLNIKLNAKLKKNRFYLNFYRGKDEFSGLTTDFGHNGISWSNTALSFRWNYIISKKLFSNLTLYGSGYNYDLNINDIEIKKWNSQINTFGLKNDFSYFISPKNTIKFGLDLVNFKFNPGNIVYNDSATIFNAPVVSNARLSSYSLYVSHEFSLSRFLVIKYGIRIPYYRNSGESTVYLYNEEGDIYDTVRYAKRDYYNDQILFEPRINLLTIINDYNSVKAEYNRNTQAIHLITNSESPFTSLDVWLPISPNIKPQIADMFSVGYYHSFHKKDISMSGEIFYKKMYNQIDYEEHANMLLNPQIEGELVFGEGESYGIELLLKKEHGRFNGWIGYTLSKATREFSEINNGKPFSASFDRLHDFVIYLSYHLKRRWLLSGTWIYSSGAPYTEPTGFYQYQGYTVPIYSEKNNERLPDYHRLDLMISFKLNRRENLRFDHQLSLSVYNVYGRENPFNVTYNKTLSESGKYEVPMNYYNENERVSTELFLMRTIPSINYVFKFK